VGARYGFGYVFGRRFLLGRQRQDVGRVATRLRLALEELGPAFVELGHVLSTRRDILPPAITVELERASVQVAPVPFAEVRALLERELGNTLERLFMKLEEAPVRTGVFTQAHPAVLPGRTSSARGGAASGGAQGSTGDAAGRGRSAPGGKSPERRRVAVGSGDGSRGIRRIRDTTQGHVFRRPDRAAPEGSRGLPFEGSRRVPRLLDGTVRDVRGPCGDRAARGRRGTGRHRGRW
jgi:hypothetical protein